MPHDHHNHTHKHDDPHNDAHGHAGHSHAPDVTEKNESRVFWVMLLTGTFMLVEVLGGVISGSLALLADAGHMLTDTAALALSWFAFRMARKPADTRRSYGYHRFQILAAFANGIALFAIAAWIIVEAIGRIMSPVEIMGWPMMIIAALGLLVNLIGVWVLSTGGHDNLNIRSAMLHVIGDLLGSVAAIIAAVVIIYTDWVYIDPILSVLVSVIILRSAWRVVSQSGHILLEGAPDGIDSAQIGAALKDIAGVKDIHHVHAWSLTNERPIVTLHAVLAEDSDHNEILKQMNALMLERFGIDHATIQIESGKVCCHHC